MYSLTPIRVFLCVRGLGLEEIPVWVEFRVVEQNGWEMRFGLHCATQVLVGGCEGMAREACLLKKGSLQDVASTFVSTGRSMKSLES